MSRFPSPPKSYSLIKNLLPSVSLNGQTSDPQQYPQRSQKIILRKEVTDQGKQIVNLVETLEVNDLKQILQNEINELQFFQNSNSVFGEFNDSSHYQNESIVLSKLKHLSLISGILVQRMNQKYVESKGLTEQLKKKLINDKVSLDSRNIDYPKDKKVKESKFKESQQTEKKVESCSEEKERAIQQQNLKTTRKHRKGVKQMQTY